MKRLTTPKKIVLTIISFVLSLLVFRTASAATMNIAKDAEDAHVRVLRCEKSQERTASLIRLANERVQYEEEKNKSQQEKLARLSEDDRASYLNFVIIDRSQAMSDVEGFIQKVSKRLALISSDNICSGVVTSNNKQYAQELIEASRKLQEKYSWLETKVKPTVSD